MTFLSKQRGFVSLVLMIFVGIGSFVTGIVATKAVNNHNAPKAEQVKAAPDSDVGVK
jgi:hypothetical protein